MATPIFNKGFEGKDPYNFKDIVRTGNICEIVRAGTPRLVSTYIFNQYSSDLDVWEKYKPTPHPEGSPIHLQEVEFVRELSKKRDQKLSDMPTTYPIGLRRVSWFIKDYEQYSYKAGIDFMSTKAEYDHIYNGGTPLPKQINLVKSKITTLRDAARFVHDDNPLDLWRMVANKIVGQGIMPNFNIFCPNYIPGGQVDFVMGMTAMAGLYAEVFERVSQLSFRTKWYHMVRRPEQVAYELNPNNLISQAYPEGAPHHPDFTAMHSAAYTALFYLTLELFDGSRIMPDSGTTVREECKIFRQNGSHWRIPAGVHTMWANNACIPMCHALVQKIIKERIDRSIKFSSGKGNFSAMSSKIMPDD